MKITLVDKNYIFNPLNLEKNIVAKVEIICDNDDQLMTALSTFAAMNFPDKSGVQSPPPETKKEKTQESIEKEVEQPQVDPISSLEIE